MQNLSDQNSTDFGGVEETYSKKPVMVPRGPLGPVFKLVHRLFEAAVIVLFAAIVCAAVWQVLNRFVLGSSLSWSEEFQRYGHIWLVFFAVPIGYRRGAHIGVDILQNSLSKRNALVLDWIIDLAWLVLGVALIISVWGLIGVAWRQTSPGIGLTMDKVYFGLVIGGAYLAFTAVDRLLQKTLGATA